MENKKISEYLLPSFAFVGLLSGLFFYFFTKTNFENYIWMTTIIIGIIPLVWKILKDIFRGHFGIDIIAIIAIIASFAMGQYLAGNIVLLMLSGGEALEAYALKRARRELSSLISNAPTFAHIKKDGNLIKVDVHEVKVGDIILIKTGEIIAADGIVILGKSQVDESALTGESLPSEKEIGSNVFSGSINKSDILEVKVIRSPAESKYEQIIALIKKAEENRAPVVRLADKYSIWFTLVTFVLALGAWFLAKDSVRLLAVLVVATPCPLILATPIAMISGISRSAKRGIIVKNGGALEVLAETHSFIFDKTGTLTLGQPEIVDVITFENKDKNEIIKISASLDQMSLHVLARSLQSYALKNKIDLTIPTNFKENFGEGVVGDINGETFFFGKLKFLEEKGIKISEDVLAKHTLFKEKGNIAVYCGNKNSILGIVVFADIVRPEIKNLFSNLRKQGVQNIVMLTGDKESVAKVIAKELGIDDVHAEALPENKVHEVLDHKKQFGKVAMIGDGVNDAPALTTADVGIALGGHGSSTSDSGDIVIMVDNLERVGEAYIIAKKTLKIAKQGIFFGIGISILLMIIAAFGYISPIYGALIQEALDVAIILNALRVNLV